MFHGQLLGNSSDITYSGSSPYPILEWVRLEGEIPAVTSPDFGFIVNEDIKTRLDSLSGVRFREVILSETYTVNNRDRNRIRRSDDFDREILKLPRKKMQPFSSFQIISPIVPSTYDGIEKREYRLQIGGDGDTYSYFLSKAMLEHHSFEQRVGLFCSAASFEVISPFVNEDFFSVQEHIFME